MGAHHQPHTERAACSRYCLYRERPMQLTGQQTIDWEWRDERLIGGWTTYRQRRRLSRQTVFCMAITTAPVQWLVTGGGVRIRRLNLHPIREEESETSKMRLRTTE